MEEFTCVFREEPETAMGDVVFKQQSPLFSYHRQYSFGNWLIWNGKGANFLKETSALWLEAILKKSVSLSVWLNNIFPHSLPQKIIHCLLLCVI